MTEQTCRTCQFTSYEKFADPEGVYSFNGCGYDNVTDVIQTGVLGFCGCGNPEENLLFVRDVLDHIDMFMRSPLQEKEDFSVLLSEFNAREQALFGNSRLASFVYYSLDKMGLTEHGGAIPGWLTETGKQLLDDLNKLRPALERENQQ